MSNDNRYRLLTILADGRFHSGERLGESLGVSRAAVWKQLKALESMGIEIHRVPGKGYRLPAPVELLDAQMIHRQLAEKGLPAHRLEVHPRIESTNTHLMQMGRQGNEQAVICLAETQTAGRGRHGRQWISAFGSNLYLSVLWRFRSGPSILGGMSLAAGVAVMQALESLGISGPRLKWPNDLLWERRKLGGILVEVAGETAGPCFAVVGIGLNLHMPMGADQDIDQPWTDLYRVTAGSPPSRNHLASAVAGHLLNLLATWEETGFAPYVEPWCKLDAYADQKVTLVTRQGNLHGVARGIDETGSLMIEREGRLGAYAIDRKSVV